jgi:hypothetical protein
LLSIATLAFLSHLSAPDIRLYVAVLSVGAGCCFFATSRSGRARPEFVLVTAALLHLIALSGQPAFEDDFERFIWDGWRTLASGSPYGIAPEYFFVDASVPEPLQRVLDGINNPEHPTIYGPVLEWVFAIAYAIGGADPIVLRMMFAVANLALIALLLRRTAPQQAALYAWSPFALAEIILHVHPDGIMALFLCIGLIAAATRPALCGAALGLAAGCKIVALAAWPMLLRLHPRALIAAIATLAIAYLPFLLQPTGAGFETTSMFAQTWVFNPLYFAALDAVAPASLARILCAVLGIVAIAVLHWRTRQASDTPLASIFGIILLISPTVNPWYLLWVAPFAIGRPALWPYAAAIVLPLSYLTGLHLNTAELGPYVVHPWAWAVEIVVISAALLFDLYRRRAALRGR